MDTNSKDFVVDDLMQELQEVEQYFQSLGLAESINKIFERPNVEKLVSEIFSDLKRSADILLAGKAENCWKQFYYDFTERSFMENVKMNYKLKARYTLKETLAFVHDQSLGEQIVKAIKLQFDNSEEDETTQLEIANIAEFIKVVAVNTMKNVSEQQTVYEEDFVGNIGFFDKKGPKYLS